ncbi:DUF192 domain-containing protein [Candidatus Kaiserbacteria bacterium]|nr:DUF192 domain-containing protein [Candidatus Kaiserbacteria bacterium]
MSRYFYVGFLAVVVAGGMLLYTYRTPPSSTTGPPEEKMESGTQSEQTAKFGGVSLRLEYATTSAAREYGLGGRESIAEDEAMLFVFPEDDYYGFWMNDMLVPLDIFWLDSQGQVVSIEENIAPSTYPDVFYPTAPARYVLETAAGFAQAHSIAIGAPLLLKNFPSVTE